LTHILAVSYVVVIKKVLGSYYINRKFNLKKKETQNPYLIINQRTINSVMLTDNLSVTHQVLLM